MGQVIYFLSLYIIRGVNVFNFQVNSYLILCKIKNKANF